MQRSSVRLGGIVVGTAVLVLLAAAILIPKAEPPVSPSPTRASSAHATPMAPDGTSSLGTGPSESSAADNESAVVGNVTWTSGRIRGPDHLDLAVGDVATINVSSDTPGMVHAHTLKGPPAAAAVTVTPGTDVALTFSAERSDIFFVEFHGADDSRGVLTVLVVGS